ncbi:MAG: hypothetical protein H6707_09445 [Deltaproteobacteria bacterium]|nr:hypothetical protein [Deltaproteobacteria bacterium]
MPDRQLTAVILALIGVFGCGSLEAPKEVLIQGANIAYREDIAHVLEAKCVSCHSGDTPAGNYDISTWSGLLGPGSDNVVRNLIPGDATSLLLVVASKTDDTVHSGLLTEEGLARLRSWIVDANALFSRSGYHVRGWLNPTDRTAETFHGGYLRRRSWQTTECQTCHGADLEGGPSKVACSSCHSGGPFNSCTTCHGSEKSPGPPADLAWRLDPKSAGVGAHQAHIKQTLFAAIDCSTCHKVPSKVEDAGHLFDDETTKATDFKAELTFDGRSNQGGVTAAYNSETASCTTYCHGASLSGATAPTWTAPGSVTCGKGCHPVPHAAPKSYGGSDCSFCHKSTERCTPGDDGCLSAGVRFAKNTDHGDGKLSLGDSTGSCFACHGTEQTKGAPAPSLSGATETTDRGVGAHAAHLTNSNISNAIPCESCHKVPTQILEAGHLDSDLPAEITFSDFARGATRGMNTNPAYDVQTLACTNTYCHSLDGGKRSEWVWNKSETVGCDSCHSLPPTKVSTGGSHPSSGDCTLCHSAAYVNGQIDPSKHINGKVDLK